MVKAEDMAHLLFFVSRDARTYGCPATAEIVRYQVNRFGALALWRFGGLAVWRFGALALWRCGALAVWRLGGLALWRVGALAVWRFGGLAPEITKVTIT